MIAVHLLDQFGRPATGHRAIPCISLRYTFAEPMQVGSVSHMSGLERVWALLDTGADWNLISKDLIPASSPVLDIITNHGVGGAETVSNHRVWFMIDDISLCHGTGIAGMTIHGNAPYKIILGRKFLATCRFTYDGGLGTTMLEYVGGPEKM